MASRVYRVLLRLYPSSFRWEYGGEMAAMFEQRLLRASGAFGLAALWVATFADVAASALRVHLDVLAQDLRYTARTVTRTPGFALTAVLLAALGVGATTTTFSITDRVLIRPLPFPDSERLVALWEDQEHQGFRSELSPGNFRDWKRLSRSFDAMAAYANESLSLTGDGTPEKIPGAGFTEGMFELLGARAAIGRTLEPADFSQGAAGVVVLSDGLWRGRFGSDPEMLGRKLVLDDAPYVVVGVMPRGFFFPGRDAALWTPLRFTAENYADRSDTYIYGIGRLARGKTLAAARAEMDLLAARSEKEFPKENEKLGIGVYLLKNEVGQQARLLVVALFGASLGVLLIACTNLANLLLARAISRRRELAVRAAMGAGRERLIRQLLTESAVLAVVGGALGIGVAVVAVPLLSRLVPTSLPLPRAGELNLRILAFAAVLTGVTGIGFGVLPALRACGSLDSEGLKDGDRAGATRRTERLRSALVSGEVMASVVLLICSGLLIRALWRLQDTAPGFRSEGVLTMRTTLPLPKYAVTERRERLYRSVISGIRALPGVTDAAYTSALPMVMTGGIWPVLLEGEPESTGRARPASFRYVTSGYFSTMGIPLLRGRGISVSDAGDAPYVAVVSASFVAKYMPGESSLGRRFKIGLADRTVVGVVGDVRVRGPERASEPQVYVPSGQVPDNNIIGYTPKDLVIRSAAAPATLVPSIRRIVASADSLLPISDIRPLTEIVDAQTAPRRIQVRVLGGFAATALLLAGIGIHGLIAFTVSRRSREIGVRMALGAGSADVLRLVLRQAFLLALGGVIPGALLAYAAGRAMQGLLAGIPPADAATFGVAIGASIAMTVAGSFFPALRAVRLDPATVMRTD